MSQVAASQVVEFVLQACTRATKSGHQYGDVHTLRKVFLIRDKKEIVQLFRACKSTNTELCKLLESATDDGYWTWATRISNWIMADNKGKLNIEEAVAVQRRITVQAPLAKQMTIDIAHRLVAYDCDIGQLQATLDNFKESYQSELDRQQAVIDNRINELNQLKAEYNVA